MKIEHYLELKSKAIELEKQLIKIDREIASVEEKIKVYRNIPMDLYSSETFKEMLLYEQQEFNLFYTRLDILHCISDIRECLDDAVVKENLTALSRDCIGYENINYKQLRYQPLKGIRL